MNRMEVLTETTEARPIAVSLPAPTPWPIVIAFGTAVLFAGLVTSGPVSALGVVLLVVGCVGWFRDVLPEEKEETVEAKESPRIATSLRHTVERLPVAPELPRPLLPLESYPVLAGIKGG